MDAPMLSVCMMTYNHAPFIEQSIQGIINQQVDFKWEVIIAEDCSTDGTRAIVERYAQQYPDLIKVILQPKNVGAAQNFADLIAMPEGKYIAYLEGDDYWTDPHKLQKQVDFLEANPDFAICFHNTQVIYQDGSREPSLFNHNQKEVTTFEDIATLNYIRTVSCVYRNKLFSELPDWYYKQKIGDWTLHLLNAQHGKIKYLDDVMAVYRVHSGGSWSMKDWKYWFIHSIEAMEQCRAYFAPRGTESFNKFIYAHAMQLCYAYFDEGDFKEFRKYYRKSLKAGGEMSLRTRLGLVARYIASHHELSALTFTGILTKLRTYKSRQAQNTQC